MNACEDACKARALLDVHGVNNTCIGPMHVDKGKYPESGNAKMDTAGTGKYPEVGSAKMDTAGI